MDGFPVPEVAAGEMQGLGEPQTAVDSFDFFKPKIYRHLLHERELQICSANWTSPPNFNQQLHHLNNKMHFSVLSNQYV